MRRFLFCAVALLIALPSLSFGAIIGSTNPNDFLLDTINWCTNYGCGGGQFPTPQGWVSDGGKTGLVGLVDTNEGFFNLRQGFTWAGNFEDGMGLIYNGANFGNVPTDIAVTFDDGQYGAGAWIQANFFGPFDASVTAFDINYQPLFTFTASGISTTTPGTALFIGLLDTSPEIYALQFHALGVGPHEPDFAIGSVQFGPTVAPEPSTLLLLGMGLLGVVVSGRKR